ncbi:FMN-binding protein [Microbacterium sp. 22242]|uniref:FMN-binding protein n=1 Tax=Microbacterium sp. 22242 TaxID=3453896 RepID=UPI003F85CBC6
MKISSTVRQGGALVGVAGALLLSGCAAESSSAAGNGAAAPESTAGASAPSSPVASAPAGSGAYKDGTYTADGSYQTPETVEKISVTVTLASGTVTKVSVTGKPQASETRHYQAQFIGGISALVVGKRLDELSVDRVAGSSLTSKGFNQAIAAIRTEAAG